MIAMDQTIAGAASGETAMICGAEGFIISGKRTEEYRILFVIFFRGKIANTIFYSVVLRDWSFPVSFLFAF